MFDSARRHVVSRKDADFYPIATEGIVVVRGSGLAGEHTASINIPDGAYAPGIIVV